MKRNNVENGLKRCGGSALCKIQVILVFERSGSFYQLNRTDKKRFLTVSLQTFVANAI